jgi:hypothetical protein
VRRTTTGNQLSTSGQAIQNLIEGIRAGRAGCMVMKTV